MTATVSFTKGILFLLEALSTFAVTIFLTCSFNNTSIYFNQFYLVAQINWGKYKKYPFNSKIIKHFMEITSDFNKIYYTQNHQVDSHIV